MEMVMEDKLRKNTRTEFIVKSIEFNRKSLRTPLHWRICVRAVVDG